jgi:hypothetical protein
MEPLRPPVIKSAAAPSLGELPRRRRAASAARGRAGRGSPEPPRDSSPRLARHAPAARARRPSVLLEDALAADLVHERRAAAGAAALAAPVLGADLAAVLPPPLVEVTPRRGPGAAMLPPPLIEVALARRSPASLAADLAAMLPPPLVEVALARRSPASLAADLAAVLPPPLARRGRAPAAGLVPRGAARWRGHRLSARAAAAECASPALAYSRTSAKVEPRRRSR